MFSVAKELSGSHHNRQKQGERLTIFTKSKMILKYLSRGNQWNMKEQSDNVHSFNLTTLG